MEEGVRPAPMGRFYHLQGIFDREKTYHDESYYRIRGIWLDCRGTLLVKKGASLEWGVRILTLSHPLECLGGGPNVDRPVVIEPQTWICSFATLFNCHIGEGAIVATSSVVRSQDVPPWTMVAGNPAQIIARYNHEEGVWEYLERPEVLPRRRRE